jgi:hypothetical protein
VRVVGAFARLTNLRTGAVADGEAVRAVPSFLAPPSAVTAGQQFGYELRIEPHSFVAFREH